MARERVSLTMIVRDEAVNLAAALGPVAPLFDEVVVVDTGSADRSREVAAGLGARVVEFPWADDFAAARNDALRHATGGWAFKLDADDRVEGENVARLPALLAGLTPGNVAYTVRYCHHTAGPAGRLLAHDDVRLFPNRPDIRWRYRAHEQILGPVREAGGSVARSGVEITHLGYADPGRRRAKLERNLRLLELNRADHPTDPFILHNLGWTLLDLGRPSEAEGPLRAATRTPPPGPSTRPRSFTLLVRTLRRLGRPADALVACREGLGGHPMDAELVFQEGWLLLGAGRATEAERRFRDLLGGRAVVDELSFEDGLCGYQARYGLAVACGPGRAVEQEALWRDAVAERPDFGPAWLGLGGLLAAAGRWADLRATATAAARAIPSGPEGAVLGALEKTARGAYRDARRELGQCVTRHPGSVVPLLALARTLLLEGRDHGAAERAVAAALRLDPTNADAARLRDLVARWGRAGG